jgi:hypothetical protein
MQFGVDCYLLIWRQNIVFKAQVNQSSFDNEWTFLTYDNLDSNYSFLDAEEGYTVWISPTEDIRDFTWWGRLRDQATSSILSVEWNSFQPSDDDYIFITKDIRESSKTPRLSGSSWLSDYAITYHAPSPIIYDIPTFMFAQIDDDGNADITITPNAYAVASGATISSWALTDTNGGTQISFDAASGDTVIRYTEPGDYMPRLTVTDSNGNTQWFSPFVTIDDASLSSAVKLKFNELSITASVDNGWNMSMPLWDGVQNVLDGSMCAVYMPHQTGGNKLLFCGRIRTESTTYTANGQGFVGFNVEGLASIMNNLNIISWRHKDTASPDDFAEIKDLTLWRSIGAYIAIMTNINNTHSLKFDETSDDYQYLSYFYQKGTMLDSLREQMWSINYDFDFTSDGMFRLNRNMRFQTIAERDALTNVANFEFKHYLGDDINDVMYSLEKDHSSQVGRATNGCGWYNTSTSDVTFFAAISPPVTPGRGTEQAVTDRQILIADQTRENAETEGKRRVRNDFAAKQVLDTLNGIRIGGAFVGKINPSVSDYYTHTITVNDGIRLLTYDSTDKWLISDLSLGWDNATGQVTVNPTWQIESEDLGFAISIRNPLPDTPYANPVQMPLPAFPTFSPNPGINSPTGASDGDEQDVEKEDAQEVNAAQDPSTMLVFNETTIAVWSASQASMTRQFGNLQGTSWTNITPGQLPAANSLYHFAWNREEVSKEGAYLVSHNADINSPDSRVYHSKSPGQLANWQEATLNDILTTMVNPTSDTNVITYGKFSDYAPAGGFPISGLTDFGGTDDMSGDGNSDLLPSSQSSLSSPSSHYAGVYSTTTQLFNGGDGDNGGIACDIKWAIPPGVTVTDITFRGQYNRPATTTEGYKYASIESDTLTHGSQTVFPLNLNDFTVNDSVNMPIAAGTQTHLYFHISIDKKSEDGAGIIIEGIQINGTVESDWVGTRYSTDNAETFEASIGVGLMTLGDGSMARRVGQRVLAAKDEQVKRAPLAGQSYLFNADQGATAGKYAKALLKFGKDDDYLLAPDSGTPSLYKIISNVRTDISPNDGSFYGDVVSVGCLAVSAQDNDKAWYLGEFGTVMKLAYTTNLQGTTTWNFTTGFSTDANWVAINPRNDSVVYVADGSSIWRSLDGGVVFTEYDSPIGSLVGVEPL